MTKFLLRVSSRYQQRRDAKVAAALSIVSGLGQIYNGQRRKGLLFLAVLFMIVQTILWCLFNSQSLLRLHIGATQWQAIFYFLGFFTIYTMQDAYCFAAAKRNRKSVSASALELSEAASVSFLVHYIS